MDRTANLMAATDLMQEFAGLTGLDPSAAHLRRYLWTDAFAVCTYLGLFEKTGNATFRELALRLVGQVHHTLGRYRDDDARAGWISGFSRQEGEIHPTAGGLRIGKSLPERPAGEPYDEQGEWDRDGQYFHYLTKWMHALSRAGRVTGNPDYLRWAIGLARTAHARFTYLPPGSHRKRMYWKMSTNLTRPLVLSMGQHDPLDGFVTYNEVQLVATRDFSYPAEPGLMQEIEDMTGICQGISMATDDPLGIGGLLCDASWITGMTLQGGPAFTSLLETVLDSALAGLASYTGSGSLDLPARYRLAFREFGLSAGLAGVKRLREQIRKNPGLFKRADFLDHKVEALIDYLPVREQIEGFWLEENNRMAVTWTDHREINLVMLATSLEPGGFLGV